ncbi:No apical meristem (NAM) [Olea europaea subsp. europaea]|uniref:No apical meristem (NAM) n=1 Tax=Olea europaea subsp. europaea TaxID=158383 RepID=A0A8S0VKA3_OLEEU|nr:No apical meristem (NAM) [Olea europaea subsp. europaea]
MAFSLPPGFVYKPTDQQLITHLKRKATGILLTFNRILDRNLYGKNGTPWIVFSENDPWEIVGDSEVGVSKKELYVITKLEKIRTNHIVRVAGCGTWAGKSMPKDIKNCEGEVIGVKKSFTFKQNGDLKQDKISMKNGRWIMHEYTLAGSSLEGVHSTDYAICRISWDLPKYCVEEGSWPTERPDIEPSLIEENSWNPAPHDQEMNSEANLSWPTEMPDIEPSLIEEMNSEANLSWPTEMPDIEPSLIEENSWNPALHDQEMNSEANLSWLTELTDANIIPDNFHV